LPQPDYARYREPSTYARISNEPCGHRDVPGVDD